MSLLVDVQEVPWRILEAVQARILANRARKQRREEAALVRGFTRPRPQQRRMGATMSTYRTPEPVPLVLSDVLGNTGLVWLAEPARPLANFSASWMWSSLYRLPSTGQPAQFLIDANDRWSYSIGSGDGSTWLEGSLHLPGIHAFRQAYYDFFSPGLPPLAGNSTTYFVSDPVGSFYRPTEVEFDDSLQHTACLPVGNGSALVLVMARAGGCWAGSKLVVTASSQTTYNGETVWTFTTEDREFVVSEPQTVQASDVQAYLVSQTTCRQVTVPTALRSRLDDLLLKSTITNPIPWVPVTGVPAINVFTATGPDAYWFSNGIYRYRKYESLYLLDVFRSYGAKPGVMAIPEQSPYLTPITYSPAVYVPLLKDQELFAASEFPNFEDPNIPYTEGRSRLQALGAPAPSHVVGFDVRLPDYQAIHAALSNEEPGYIGYNGKWTNAVYKDPQKLLQGLTPVRSNTQPTNLYDQLPQAGAWQSLRRLPLDPDRLVRYGADTAHALLWHYDWGQPAYCRQQLLALGFTEADLTP